MIRFSLGRITATVLLALIALTPIAKAQSNPNLVFGYVPTPAQWNSYFTSKVDISSGASTNQTLTTPTLILGSGTQASCLGITSGNAVVPLTGACLTTAGNLAGLASAATARTNLGAAYVGSACSAHQWIDALSSGSTPTCAQPTASDVQYTATGTGGTARSQAAKNADVVSILDYGGNNTCSAANDTAIANAFANLSANGGEIYFPGGCYTFNSADTLAITGASGTGLKLQGVGPGGTVLNWPNAGGGLIFTRANTAVGLTIKDLSLTTSQVVSGTAVAVTDSANVGNCCGVPVTLDNVDIRGYTLGTDTWNMGVSATTTVGLNMIGGDILGLTSGHGVSSTGFSVQGTSASGGTYAIQTHLSGVQIVGWGTGFLYGPYTQGVTIDGGSLLGGNDRDVYAPSGQSGVLSALYIDHDAFNCYVDCINTTNVNFLAIHDNNFSGASGAPSNSLITALGTYGTFIHHNVGVCNSATNIGIDFGWGGTAYASVIDDNVIVGCNEGAQIENSAKYLGFHNNSLVANTTPLVNNIMSGNTLNSYVENNQGYNPLGLQTISATGSPMTIGPFLFPVTLNVTGGTVTSVTLTDVLNTTGSITVCSASPCTLYVPRWQEAIVIYSGSPTLKAIYH